MNQFWFVIILICQGKMDSAEDLQGSFADWTRSAPYVVSIQNQGLHICGGSIINLYWVLTAVSCVHERYKRQDRMYEIRYGHPDCYHEDPMGERTRFMSNRKLYKDIALVKVHEQFILREAPGFATLPQAQNELPNGLKGQLYGWDLQPNYNQRNLLKVADLTIYPNTVGSILRSNEFTAVGDDFGVGEGYGGSPLIYNGTLIGVASSASKFDGKTPNIFYRVSLARQWINDTIIT